MNQQKTWLAVIALLGLIGAGLGYGVTTANAADKPAPTEKKASCCGHCGM